MADRRSRSRSSPGSRPVPDAGPQALGLVLAGGLARRMGGHDKTLMRLDDRHRLLDVLLGRLAPQCVLLAISANGDPDRFADTGLPILPDRPGPSRGPLAGVLAGLDHATAVDAEGWLLTVPGDTPFVPADLAARLAAAANASGMPVARATCGGRLHSLVALWSCGLQPALQSALMDHDLRKVTAFQADVGAVDVPWSGDAYDPFFNVNTSDDLDRARIVQRQIAGKA